MTIRYTIAGRELVLIDGELYERIPPTGSPPPAPFVESDATSKGRRGRPRGRKPRGTIETIREFKERKRRKVLGPDAEEAVIQDIKNGLGVVETCAKYEISVATFYRLKGESMNKPVVES
jgi:hypothetical protein